MRGSFYEQEEDYIKALKDFNTALKYTPDKLKLLSSLMNLKIKLKDYDGALTNSNQIIILQPDNFKNYMDRAYIFFELGQYKNSINDYTKAIVLKPKNPEAFKLRGMIEILNNQKENGFKDLNYAKQQYYELEMYKEYQDIVNYINELNTIKSKKVKYYTNTDYINKTIIYPVDNYEIQKQLEDINTNLRNIDRTLYMNY